MIRRYGWVVTAGLVCLSACAPSVSDHDNRIFAAVAAVKLSAVDLSLAYAADRRAADGRFRSRAIEISGVVRGISPDAPVVILAGAESAPGVEAWLHDDVSVELLKTVIEGQRVTLKCFCEGLDEQVRLKSCVTPVADR